MRKFIAETSMEFFEFIKDIDNVPHNKMNDKKIYFDKFCDEYQDFKKWLTRKKFNIWVQKYCNFNNFKYEYGNTNGVQWFRIESDLVNKLEDDDNLPF